MQKAEWFYCPICGNKTRDKIREDTVLINYPLYCPKCKREHRMVWNISKMLSVSVMNLKYHSKDHKDFTSLVVLFCLCSFFREQIPFFIVFVLKIAPSDGVRVIAKYGDCLIQKRS